MDDVQFIAEFTTNPMGNFNLLMKMVEMASEVGCNLIKMQKKDVKTFYTPEKLALPYDSPYGKTYGEYREMFEFSEDDFRRFNEKCKKHKIGWFSTVQDIPSLDFLLKFDIPIYKVASINIRDHKLIDTILDRVPTSKEIVVSTAGATIEEIDYAFKAFSNYEKLTILHCVAEYPCNESHCKLSNITKMKERYERDNVRIGYSGHEEGYIPSLVAVGLGAEMVERHFCISRCSFVHHIECSLEPDEYKEMINIVRGAKDRKTLLEYASQLPDGALSSNFGMSEIEKDFLIDNKYGHKYVKDQYNK